MRTLSYIILFFLATSFRCTVDPPEFKAGDILFQDSESNQSRAIKYATKSNYSHCGVVLLHNGRLEVLEAVQPVKWTSIDTWIKQGKEGKYAIKRTALTKEQVNKMSAVAAPWVGKNYDIQFNWSNEKLYCSELVWKVFKKGAGVELCPLRPLKDYRLDAQLVQQQLQLRYGSKIPLDELMVSPEDIFKSKKLY